MRFKTFTVTYYHFPIKCTITRVLPPEAEKRRRQIAKMQEYQGFTDDLKESVQMARNGRWLEVINWQN